MKDEVKLIPSEHKISCEVYEWLLKMMEEAVTPNEELTKLFKEYEAFDKQSVSRDE